MAVGIASPAQAIALTAPAGSVGYDISYPQCTATFLPTHGAFGVVGVNHGKAFADNTCLKAQFDAMSAHNYPTGLYINTGNPLADPRAVHRPDSKASQPAYCGDNTDDTDLGCSYDYGWQAAADAVAFATAQGVPITTRTWWLDVEIANSWSGDPVANTADLQGAADALHSLGVSEVGIYSSAKNWNEITGGYTTLTAVAYRTAWHGTFTPALPLETLPVWVAGGNKAPGNSCAASFTGAPVRLAQYLETINGTTYDADQVCGGVTVAAVPPTKPGKPRKAEAHMAHSKGIKLKWESPSSSGGAVVTKYQIYRGTAKSKQSSYKTVSCSSSSCSWTDPKAKHHKRYYYRLAAVNIVGTGSKTSRVDAIGR
ncbi:MAG TPA: hypothetical protein VE081_01655 [Sporichthyaceae bacterium]|nr:hypothetical protein [Sporichthyaceae bacterium]